MSSAAKNLQVLPAGQPPVEGALLAQSVAEVLPDGVQPRGHVVARDLDLAHVGQHQTGDDLEQGALARAVGSEQAERLARRQGEADVVEDQGLLGLLQGMAEHLPPALELRKALGQAANRDHGLGTLGHLPVPRPR